MSKLVRLFIIGFIVIAIILLFRTGASVPAGLLSFILFAAALAEKVMRIHYTKKMYDQQGSGQSSSLSRKEALEMLELDDNATEDDIKKSYKKLMQKIHPDAGGSKYLAAKLNEAKDVLLK
jgi:DnaJ-domain-containing protein 1